MGGSSSSSPRAAAIVGVVTLGLLALLGWGLFKLVHILDVEPAQPSDKRQMQAGLHEESARADGGSSFVRRPRRTSPDASAPPSDPNDPFAKVQITGRVYDSATSNGIVGAAIRFVPAAGQNLRAQQAVSSEAGHFGILGIAPGKYDIVVRASGYMPYKTSFRKFSAVEDDTGFDFGLDAASLIEGRVVDEAGRPVEGASISAVASETTMIGADTPGATSDKDGRFVIDPVVATQVALFTAHPKYRPETTIVPAAPDPVRQVQVKLQKGRTIVGVVTGPNGPIEGAFVRPEFLHTEQRGVYFSRSATQFAARTNPDGRFELTAPAVAHLKLRAEAKGFQPRSRRVVLKGSESEEIQFRLEPATALRGVVLGANGQPAAGAEIRVTTPSRGFGSGTSGDDGRFVVDSLPEKGPYSIAVTHHDHPPLLQEETSIAGELTLRLEASGGFRGRVIDATTGEAIPEYGYRLRGTIRQQNVVSSLSGALEIENLPPGNYTLTIRAEGYQTHKQSGLTVSLGDTVGLGSIALKRGGTLAGSVQGDLESGEVLVQAFRGGVEDASFENGALVQQDGSFIVTNLPEGTYTLVAIGGAQRGTLRDVQLSPGGVQSGLVIELRPSSER